MTVLEAVLTETQHCMNKLKVYLSPSLMPKTPVSAFALVFSSGVNAPYGGHTEQESWMCVFSPSQSRVNL